MSAGRDDRSADDHDHARPAGHDHRVKQAESDFQTATAAGINDSTPLLQATAAFNSAAFALEVAWLKLLLPTRAA